MTLSQLIRARDEAGRNAAYWYTTADMEIGFEYDSRRAIARKWLAERDRLIREIADWHISREEMAA